MMIDARNRCTLRIPETLMAMLQKEASRLGVSLNALILQILWQWTEKETAKNER